MENKSICWKYFWLNTILFWWKENLSWCHEKVIQWKYILLNANWFWLTKKAYFDMVKYSDVIKICFMGCKYILIELKYILVSHEFLAYIKTIYGHGFNLDQNIKSIRKKFCQFVWSFFKTKKIKNELFIQSIILIVYITVILWFETNLSFWHCYNQIVMIVIIVFEKWLASKTVWNHVSYWWHSGFSQFRSFTTSTNSFMWNVQNTRLPVFFYSGLKDDNSELLLWYFDWWKKLSLVSGGDCCQWF